MNLESANRAYKPSGASARKTFSEVIAELRRVDTFLLERVAVAHGDGSGSGRLSVHGDAERCTDLVLSPIAAADRATVVVEDGKFLSELGGNFLRHLRHSVLLHQRKNSRLDRRQRRVQCKHG